MSEYERSLKDVDTFIFDLDYTVWHWNRLIPNVKDTIEDLRSKGKDIYYVTNNALLTRKGFADKLTDLGLKTDRDHVMSAGWVAARTLEQAGVESVYAIGEQALSDELERRDIQTSKNANNVLVGYDRNFNFWKMARAAELVRSGANFYTCGMSRTFQTGTRTLPGSQSITESIRVAAKADEPEVLGKPSKHMADAIKQEFPVGPGETVMIGDDVRADVALGNRIGVKTGLVLGGETEKEELQDVAGLQVPDYVFQQFERILMKV